jgi:hypothetical protein
MRDVVRDPAALERLRVQRSRLADRLQPPWWYLTGSAISWAVLFAGPFILHYLLHGVPRWPSLILTVAALCLLRLLPWGLTRATGIAVRLRNLRYRGRPALIAMIVVWFAASETETFMIRHGLLVGAIVVAALAVAAQAALLQARLRGIRQDLRAGEGAA